MKISVVIPVFNKSQLTERCFGSILQNSSMPHELIVIDNASKDNTAEILLHWKSKFEKVGWKFQIQTNLANVGFGRAMNQGAKSASGEFLALVNNDTWLLPEWDIKLLKGFEDHPEVSLLCPHINEEKPFNVERVLRDGAKFQAKNAKRVRKKFCAVFLFFKKADFFQIGAFDERYFVTYEDTDLKERMDREGYLYLTLGSCLVWHESMATRSTSNLLPSGYEIEGKRLFMDKWGFDPSLREKTTQFRWKRRWGRFLERFGYL